MDTDISITAYGKNAEEVLTDAQPKIARAYGMGDLRQEKTGLWDPFGESHMGVLSISDRAVVTSGNYERYFIGGLYDHQYFWEQEYSRKRSGEDQVE